MRPPDEALQLLARATDLLAKCTDYEATLECIADLLVTSLATWCVIDLVTDDGKIERAAVTHRNSEKANLTRTMLQKYPAKPTAQRGVYKVIASGETIMIPETSEEFWARRADDPEHLRMIVELGSSSYMCVPLKARGKVVGSIMLFSESRTYDQVDVSTAEQLARCIAMAVDNVHMFRQMQSTQDQLIQSAKLAALGVISAGIAHEINNPLTIIKGHLKCFERSLEKRESEARSEFHQCVEKVDKSIARISKIVNHVKDFSRQSEGDYLSLDLRNVVDSVLGLFEQQFFLHEIKVHKHFPESPALVKGDFIRLEQVLVNIVSNAKDAIRARVGGGGGNIHIEVSQQESHACISISDDGIGISALHKERVFEPFFTTKVVGKGTGLGLSISHGIVKDHQGKIELHSEEKKGTRILITLPRAVDV
ncbi:ATP-binding protein [Bdellovibrio sp. HCB337]|uniref:GAF domain-containing sensor histidine kinase n=1 Tax=Bdellovibrio sp. HCB337 TaxID=3394358 RepID=UPI0039A4667B